MAIDRWQEAIDMPERAVAILEVFERWLADKSSPEPDLVECLAAYGHARLLLQDRKLPIDVPESEFDAWRSESHYMALGEFQERLAEVVGGFMELSAHEVQAVGRMIQQQLDSKLAELETLASRSLDSYTPQYTEEALIARFTAEGLTGDILMGALKEEMTDSGDFDEQNMFDRPFALRQELDCFEWGMEKFRLFAITEYEPEIGLPNKQLHEALMQIDLNGLLARLEQIDVKLRRILQHLAKHNYYNLNVAYEPEQFWWRHWKKQPRKK